MLDSQNTEDNVKPKGAEVTGWCRKLHNEELHARRIWGSYSRSYEEYDILECNAV
jgi:hypothetical protein